MANLIKIKRGTRQQLTTAGGNTTLNQGEPYFITGETVATPAEARLAVGISNTEFVSFVKETELKDATLTLQMGTAAATNTTVTIGTGTGFSANTATNATYTIRIGPALTDLAATMTGAGTGFLKKDGADNFILDTNTYLTSGDLVAPGNGTLGVSISVTAANSGTALSWGTGTGFSANTGTNTTYDLRIGPALKDLAETMTGAGTGLLKKDGADNFVLDTNPYITGNQSISVTGDATGSGTTSIALTLKNTGTAGTYTKVTTDAQGRVSSGTTLSASDIPDLTAAKITDFNTTVRTSRLDQMAAPTASVSLNNQTITGLADPQNAQDAATKAYVDAAAQGVVTKNSVRAATTTNITLSGTQTIDGVNVIADDRVLVKNQSTASQNGIYIVASGPWSRAADANTWNELISAYTFVEEGTLNSDNGYLITVNAGGTLGVTDVTVAQFSGAGQITAGAGLTKNGNQIDVVGTANRIVANENSIDIDAAYVGQTSITTLGTIGAGTWQGNTIGVQYGGTGATSLSGILKGNGTSAFSVATEGTDYLSANSTIDGGTF
jgi:hypothetical protein